MPFVHGLQRFCKTCTAVTQRRSYEKPFAFSELVISNVGSGASDVFARTLPTGISRSRSVRITAWKTFNVSSQLSMEENRMDQSTTLRYLPNSALRHPIEFS